MKHAENILKNLRRLAASHLPSNEPLPKAAPVWNPEPLNLNRRVVFREAGRVPEEIIAAMHHLIQSTTNEATKTLSYSEMGNVADDSQVSLYSAARNFLDEYVNESFSHSYI